LKSEKPAKARNQSVDQVGKGNKSRSITDLEPGGCTVVLPSDKSKRFLVRSAVPAKGNAAGGSAFFVYWWSQAVSTRSPSRENDMTAKRALILLAVCALLLPAVSARAEEIYRWVDQSGVVHFSDAIPAAAVADVSTVVLEETLPPDYDPEADLYNVAAQAERMQALREVMAKEREARRERQRSAAQAPAEQDGEAVRYPYNYGNIRYPRPPARPPTGPRPPVPEPYETSTLRPPGGLQDR